MKLSWIKLRKKIFKKRNDEFSEKESQKNLKTYRQPNTLLRFIKNLFKKYRGKPCAMHHRGKMFGVPFAI